MLFTGRGVDENHLHPRGLSGPLELRQVAVVEPGRLHSLEAGLRGRVYPLAEVWQLGEEPGNVGTEPERSHVGTDECAAPLRTGNQRKTRLHLSNWFMLVYQVKKCRKCRVQPDWTLWERSLF